MRESRPTIRRWLGASCAVALICAGVSTRAAWAQTSSGASKTASKSKSQAAVSKAAGASKTSSKTATASKSASKGHTGSHSASAAHSKSKATTVARSGKGRHTSSGKSKKTTARGQQKIDPQRAQEIQEALVREHYLSGEAAGSWNQASEDAMRRYQADHGWQSKTVPDSRALISLGLGPSHDHLLNPESAMVMGPFPTHSASLTPVSHSASPDTQGSTPASSAPLRSQSSDPDSKNPQ